MTPVFSPLLDGLVHLVPVLRPLVPVSMVRENFKRYARSSAITEFKEFPGRSHLIAIQDGWQEVAEYALSWVQAKAGVDVLRKAA